MWEKMKDSKVGYRKIDDIKKKKKLVSVKLKETLKKKWQTLK